MNIYRTWLLTTSLLVRFVLVGDSIRFGSWSWTGWVNAGSTRTPPTPPLLVKLEELNWEDDFEKEDIVTDCDAAWRCCCSSRDVMWRCCSSRDAMWRCCSSRDAIWRCCSSRDAMWRCCSSLEAMWRCCSSRDAMWRCCSSLEANCDGGGRGETEPAFGGLLDWKFEEDGTVELDEDENCEATKILTAFWEIQKLLQLIWMEKSFC